MKKLYSKLLTLVTIGFYSLSVWAQDAPVIQNYSDYTGDSFVANWDKVSGADKYFLNVYTNGTNVQNVNETFGNINHSDGKIDQQSPNYPNGWEINVSENGSTDMVVYEGVNKIILDATDDYISTEQIIGTGVGKYIVNANLINAENITQENSSLFKIEIFDKAGILLSTGTIETLLFAQITEFNIFDGFGYTQANIGRIKISIEKGDGKIGDLMINSISYSCTEPSYILKDQATAENSYPVTNLDPEKEYYYYVAASVEGKTTDASNIIRVNGFLTPKALDATGTSENSFTANWEKLPKAKGYIVQAYQYHTATQDSEKKILDDSFEKSTEGTMDDPISVTDPDLYTAVPGWSGKNILAANGMLGADNGRFPVSLSYLWTPTMNLSSNNGKYKIHIKARGTAGDYLSIYRIGYMIDSNGDGEPDALNIHKVTAFDENGYTEETWEMEDGAENMQLSIEENKLKRFFIDEITIIQESKAGEVTRIPLVPVTISDGSQTSYTFTDLETNGNYGYEVTGMRYNDYEEEEYSETSNLITVQLIHSGIESNTTQNVKVIVSENSINIVLSERALIQIFTANGQLVKTINGTSGENIVSIPAANIYIVKVGSKIFKVIAR